MENPGDKVIIHTKEETITGILMPSLDTDKGTLILKLENGYNMGISKEKIVKIDVIEKHKQKKPSGRHVDQTNGLPRISILHTGGTIASKVDYRTGAVYSSFTPEDLLGMFPELSKIANFSSKLISKMWSDDLRFKHFSVIAKSIEEEIKNNAIGIIIGIGTDNMAVCSAALSFILEKIPIPVIFVGAQRSSDRGSSDAAMNLICAAHFITKTDFAGVGICMHENLNDENCIILPACKTYKLHSSRRDAFKPVNDIAIARVNYNTKEVKIINEKYSRRYGNNEIIIKPDMEEKVGLLKIHVNMFPEQFEFFTGYKGLIIEGTGLGHTPGQVPNDICKIHEKIYPAIKKVIDSGCIVVMTTQTIFGRVQLHVYDKGTDLIRLGVISGEDMLANTALVKLSWLIANYPKDKAEELISKDLRGEINASINDKMFLN
jgi:glutamyl-tRNA(Gln) amidotransferase subunit D